MRRKLGEDIGPHHGGEKAKAASAETRAYQDKPLKTAQGRCRKDGVRGWRVAAHRKKIGIPGDTSFKIVSARPGIGGAGHYPGAMAIRNPKEEQGSQSRFPDIKNLLL
jgi:hypothetical protein